jgi:hypothetical protein
VGHTYSAICNECGHRFEVNEGSGMAAMPLHCNRCGAEWWWEFGPGGPMDEKVPVKKCRCGGTFTEASSPRCPKCRSTNFRQDPAGEQAIYD